jgi:hypothetical protein
MEQVQVLEYMPFLVYLYGRACEIFFFPLDLGVLLNSAFAQITT